MAVRIWRMLKRIGIISPKGIFLSFIFWSLFLTFTYWAYFTYGELSRFLVKLEASKPNVSKLYPSLIKNNETLLTSGKVDAFGLFKQYWKNNSDVGNILN